ncbi:hypothetical protein GCK72_007775 [Caenorhabditis remanei]|uniref:Phlebovirus glycoprotein G2 fusion domain-containing protein n=1 Tax=Caenorhabditis remanei TaxID=31234 RepID=A0A6A5HMC0_CAERE|nr:hypothetical protein GCK72_007775 [Caenorhabditis remanei]KAF1767816.1 hypothetical protein GCK72_007775 [Caenorhabditis remanei]
MQGTLPEPVRHKQCHEIDPEDVGSVEDLLDLEQLDSRNLANYIGPLLDGATEVAKKGLKFFARLLLKWSSLRLPNKALSDEWKDGDRNRIKSSGSIRERKNLAKTVKDCGFQLLMEYQYTVEQEWIHHSVRKTQVKLRGPGTEPCFTWNKSWKENEEKGVQLHHGNQIFMSTLVEQPTHAKLSCDNEDFVEILTCSSTGTINEIHQKFNTSKPTGVCTISCGNKKSSFIIEGELIQPTLAKLSCDNEEFVEILKCSNSGTTHQRELMCVAHDSLTEYFNQILNSEKSITDIHPSQLPDWTSILDTRRKNVLHECEGSSEDHENAEDHEKVVLFIMYFK